MSTSEEIKKHFTLRRILIPIFLGLAVVGYIIWRDLSIDTFRSIQRSNSIIIWVSLAVLMVVFRFAGYVYRLYVLSEGKIGIKKSIQLISLWEFASAISPGIVGGTAVAFILLGQEKKLSNGESAAIVLVTSFLDVLFYVVAVPIAFLAAGLDTVFPEVYGSIGTGAIKWYVGLAYLLMLLWALIVYIGVFIKSELIVGLVSRIFKIKLLNKWSERAQKWSHDVATSSVAMRSKGMKYWLNAFGATVFSWTARFLLLNFLILAFGNGTEYLEIFARQLAMWGGLLIPLSPGAVGVAESLFSSFMSPYFQSEQMLGLTVILWRLISYYPYLVIGVIALPNWIKGISSKEA